MPKTEAEGPLPSLWRYPPFTYTASHGRLALAEHEQQSWEVNPSRKSGGCRLVILLHATDNCPP